MTESAGLERRYRRLLAWYPQPFRREQEEEVLAVLMAGARQGQRRPRPMETADLIRSALRMRLRPAGPVPENRAWTDGLALFSVVAPLFLLLAAILEVALPYHLPSTGRLPAFFSAGSGHPETGGLPLLHFPGFAITLGSQAILAALVLLGLRRVALAAIAASVLYWIVARHWLPDPLQIFSASVYMLEAAALIASPGPRRGRQIMTWRHGLVLLVAAAAVQASTLLYDAIGGPWRFLTTRQPGTSAYLVLSIALAVIAVSLMVALKMNKYFLLLLAAMSYPYALQLASSPSSTSSNLIGHPTPVHLALLFLPLLLLACWAVLRAVPPLRSRRLLPPDAGKSEPT